MSILAQIIGLACLLFWGFWLCCKLRLPAGFAPLPKKRRVPRVGQIACGEPILAEENIESYLPIPAESVPTGEPCFVLNVRGDSMINAGILDGDQIFVQCCQEAYNGQIVVALIDDSATVKRFYKEKDHIRLQPENDTMDPIIVDDCQVIGRVFGMMRIFH